MTGARATQLLSSWNRDEYGLIVSCSNADRSKRLTIHRSGKPRQSLIEISNELDAMEGDWFVEAISTPDSIYRDISDQVPAPHWFERQLLGRIGRLDLLREPSKNPKRDSTKQIGHAWRGKRAVVPRDAA